MTRKRKKERRARKELRAIVRKIRAIRFRLLGVLTTLPVRADEATSAGTMSPEYDEATEMRLIIQCVLEDNIKPALTSLRDVARYRAAQRKQQ
jgi:hypothetical protein